MNTVGQHKISTKYKQSHGPDLVVLDDVLGILDELMQMGGKIAQKEQQDKDDAQKKREYETSHADEIKAGADAKAARKQALDAYTQSRTQQLQADATEKDKNGPQHIAARKSAANAALLDAQAKAAEEKVAFYQGAPPPTESKKQQSQSQWASVLTPKNVAIGVGITAVGVVGYKLLTRRK